jgi:hypothetical protein
LTAFPAVGLMNPGQVGLPFAWIGGRFSEDGYKKRHFVRISYDTLSFQFHL